MRHWIGVCLLAMLSAFLQFTTVRETEQGGVVHGDAVKYVFYAYNLKHHDTFSRTQSFGSKPAEVLREDKLTLPGYPWFLSKFLGAGPPDDYFLRRVETAQALLGVATTLLTFLVALRLAPFGWAFATGLLAATQPHLIVISDYLLTETLFTPLLLAFVLVFLQAAAHPGGRRYAVGAGLLLGLACLVRPQLQIVPGLVLVAACVAPRLRPRLAQVALGCVVFAAVTLPWHMRNAQVSTPAGEPDLLVQTIYHGSFPGVMYKDDPLTLGYPYRFDPDAAIHQRDLSSAIAHVADLFATQPVRLARWYLIGKPGLFLSWGHVAGVGDIFIYPVTRSPWLERTLFRAVRQVHFWLHWPLMLTALATMMLALWRPAVFHVDADRRRSVVILAALLALMIVLHILGMALPRYNLPFRPLEFALAMAGVRVAWLASPKRFHRRGH